MDSQQKKPKKTKVSKLPEKDIAECRGGVKITPKIIMVYGGRPRRNIRYK